MSFIFKKLLPSNIRGSKWGTIIDIFQATLEDLKSEKIDRIKKREILSEATATEKMDLIYSGGHELSNLEGYTSTDDYIDKEVRTLVKRIKNKTTFIGYNYLFYIFGLIGDSFPLLLGSDSYLFPWETWKTFQETEEQVLFLDQDEPEIYYYVGAVPIPNPPEPGGDVLLLDAEVKKLYYYAGILMTDFEQTTDTGWFTDVQDITKPVIGSADGDAWFLDNFAYAGFLTRHILLSYKFRWIETETEFTSLNTAFALLNDTKQMKRKIEIPHFRVELDVPSNYSQTEYIKTYTSYDETLSATLNSKLFGNSLLEVNKIEIGSGGHADIDDGVNGVETQISIVNIEDGYFIEEQDVGILTIFNKIQQRSTFPDFSEVALYLDDTVVLYAKFPKIQWHSSMYGAMKFFFSIDFAS